MKRLITCFVIAICLAVGISPAFTRTALADETPTPIEVSGEIKASDFEDGAVLYLADDTTLDMDVPRTFTSITPNYDIGSSSRRSLTVTGSNPLVVSNPGGSAIDTASFTSEVNVVVTDSKQGIFAYPGAITIHGDATITSSDYGIYAPGGEGLVTITGDATLTALGGNGYGIYCNSGIVVGGNVNATCANTCLQTWGGSVTVTGDATLSDGGASPYNSYGVYCSSGVSIGGNLTAACTETGILCYGGDTELHGDVTIVAVSDVSGHGNGISCSGDVSMTGTVNVTSSYYGIQAWDGSVDIVGDVTVRGPSYAAIFANHSIDIKGNVDVEGGQYGICAPGMPSLYSVTVKGDTIKAVATGNSGNAINVQPPTVFDGAIEVSGTQHGLHCWGPSVEVIGDLKATSAGHNGGCGVNCPNGTLKVTGDVTAESPTGSAIHANRGLDISGNVVAKGGAEGVLVPLGTATIGGNLTASGQQGVHAAGDGLSVGGDVSIEAGDGYGILCTNGTVELFGNVEVESGRTAIYAVGQGGVKLHGDKVTATVTGDGENELCSGIYSLGPLETEGSVVATGTHYGISLPNTNATLVMKSGRIEATGSLLAILSHTDIVINEPFGIVEPVGGTVQMISEPQGNNSGVWSICEEGGAIATHVIIMDPTTPIPMFRLYNRWSYEHFYTNDTAERDKLISVGWTDEGVGWTAPAYGDPVYRLYNSYAPGGDHHYTMDKDEYDFLVSVGWTGEGIGWYSDPNQAVPVYREYNPYEFAHNHNYTADRAEHDHLISVGWNDEGIGWYGI